MTVGVLPGLAKTRPNLPEIRNEEVQDEKKSGASYPLPPLQAGPGCVGDTKNLIHRPNRALVRNLIRGSRRRPTATFESPTRAEASNISSCIDLAGAWLTPGYGSNVHRICVPMGESCGEAPRAPALGALQAIGNMRKPTARVMSSPEIP
ncbi:hypothetical protein BD779DRAFT_1477182 [Infundibulicybe gibba]|nr:hypothetical protein BD779DRAFT_1477182 [Infundibulicybe gibba]